MANTWRKNFVFGGLLGMVRSHGRACRKESSYAEFFASDEEGSDSEESENEAPEQQDYDPVQEQNFNVKQGRDEWVGRRVCKMFAGHGEFEGVVVDVNEDDAKEGYRIFRVHYFEDPEDGEDFWPQELWDVLLPQNADKDAAARAKYDKTEKQAESLPGAWNNATESASNTATKSKSKGKKKPEKKVH